MRYPLSDWTRRDRGYTFGEMTSYGRRHVGLDIVAPAVTPVYCPENGVIVATFFGKEGGNQVHIKTDSGYYLRFLHLTTRINLINKSILENEIIGTVGNTGSLAGTTPHLHFDTSKKWLDLHNFSNFVNPNDYFALLSTPNTEEKKTTIVKITIGEKSTYGQATGGCDRIEPYEIVFRPGPDAKNNIDVLTHEILHALFFKHDLDKKYLTHQEQKSLPDTMDNITAFDYFLKNNQKQN